MGKLPVPNDWNEEQNGWNILVCCVPNSQQWRAIIEGNFWDLTFWNKWDTNTGSINSAKAIANEIYESIQMACLADLTRIADYLEKITAVLVGDRVTRTVDGIEVTIADYRTTGIRPTMREIGIAPVEWQDDLGSILTGEVSLASIAKTGLVGRRIDLTPLPGEGAGLADIVDEQGAAANDTLDTLQGRFRQFDISLDGTPFEKNITETLETLFRLAGITDPEFMPNLTTVMRDALNVDGAAADTFKNTILTVITNQLGLLPAHKAWLQNLITDKDAISVVDALLLLLSALQKLDNSTSKIDARTTINLNNGIMCGTNGSGTGTTETSTVTITDEGVKVEGLLGDGT